jgi:hypothetical protein
MAAPLHGPTMMIHLLRRVAAACAREGAAAAATAKTTAPAAAPPALARAVVTATTTSSSSSSSLLPRLAAAAAVRPAPWNQNHSFRTLHTSSPSSAAAAAAADATTAAAAANAKEEGAEEEDNPADALFAAAANASSPKNPLLPKALAHRRAAVASRKPAVKKPARHQWHYCDPAYDPSVAPPPPPANVRAPPFAPLWAQARDYRQAFLDAAPKPPRGRGAFRRAWRKNLRLASDRWKQAWQRRLAEADRKGQSVQRAADSAQRAASWREWREREGGGALRS